MKINRRGFVLGTLAACLQLPPAAMASAPISPAPNRLSRSVVGLDIDDPLILDLFELHQSSNDKCAGEFNDAITRDWISARYCTYLQSLLGGSTQLRDFAVVCDETNNPPDVVDSSRLVAHLTLFKERVPGHYFVTSIIGSNSMFYVVRVIY